MLTRAKTPVSIGKKTAKRRIFLPITFPCTEGPKSEKASRHTPDTLFKGFLQCLRKTLDWIEPGGRILACVPNANSIHRQAAVKMGLLHAVDELNDTDRKIGHRRVYDMARLQQDFTAAGYRIKESGGMWLKPLSNAQLEATWNEKMIQAFLDLGEEYPDIAAEIYVVGTVD